MLDSKVITRHFIITSQQKQSKTILMINKHENYYIRVVNPIKS